MINNQNAPQNVFKKKNLFDDEDEKPIKQVVAKNNNEKE